MKGRSLKLRWLVMIAISLVVLGAGGRPQKSREAFTPPAIVPRMWDDVEMASTTLPLANPHATPKHITADYYYRIPVRPIYKSYPVYALGKEPTDTSNGSNSRNHRPSSTRLSSKLREIGFVLARSYLMPRSSTTPW